MSEHAVERAGRIYAALATCARTGEPCPTNALLRERFGVSMSTLMDALNFLIANGMIEIERPNRNRRIVHIVASGHRTA